MASAASDCGTRRPARFVRTDVVGAVISLARAVAVLPRNVFSTSWSRTPWTAAYHSSALTSRSRSSTSRRPPARRLVIPRTPLASRSTIPVVRSPVRAHFTVRIIPGPQRPRRPRTPRALHGPDHSHPGRQRPRRPRTPRAHFTVRIIHIPVQRPRRLLLGAHSSHVRGGETGLCGVPLSSIWLSRPASAPATAPSASSPTLG